MKEFLGQAVRDQVIQRDSWLIEEASKIPSSAVVGHCKQTTKFTLPDSLKYWKKATVYKSINLALVEYI